MFRAVLSLIQAFLFLISSFSVVDSSFKERTDLAAVNISSKVDFSFDSITADEIKISEEEKQLCREWFSDNIINAEKPAYDFTVGGRKFRNNTDEWTKTVGEESEADAVYRGGKTTYITLAHKKSGLEAMVEATIYEDFATCEWTVYIKNTADGKSPVIKNFNAIDTTLGTGDGELYFSKGSAPDANDFELYKSFINNLPMKFNANGGRSESFLPYFNICGKNFGAVMAVGWTGQWFASIDLDIKGVAVKARQEEFKAYLNPDDEVRSPLVSLTFYKGGNALKGFNTFRNWETGCVCPESIVPNNGFVIANEFSTLKTDDFIKKLDNIDPQILENTDYFWMDAGWYKYNEGWHDGVGNWIPDENRFPDGLKPVGDKIASMGKKFLLWYEPERVREGTFLYNEAMKHDTWIVKDGDNLLWNMGDPDACEFISRYIADSLVANGVTMYRQDFNFTPLVYWKKADENFYDGRKGICENHYVQNLYKYLDCLLDTVDGLIIDNCASGGKRLDLEMTRRSLPLWRSDYNCGNADGSLKEDVIEATQAMTYGLSCWLPYSGTNRYFHSEYASRSAILTNQSVYEPSVEEYAKYDRCSQYMAENYYPLTYGGLDTEKYLAMQFGESDEGTAIIYKREDVKSEHYTLKLNGLNPDNDYELYDIDEPETFYTLKGSELMSEGLVLTITDTPKAVVIMYKENVYDE